MKRSETTNSFSDGLVMDLNPLVTPNNVLCNALNATIITMNGNENVLQNDMGNGRVESAYLPEGYIPVGMKQYGGIIYVALYNPLTNKGLLGSFPSPERNISNSKLGQLNTEIIWNEELYTNLISRYNIFNFNNLDIIFRSGDKFSIIFITDDSWDSLSKLISNFNNANGDMIKCYKNKFISFSVLVLDNNNNLQDITQSLRRFDSKNSLVDTSSYSQEVKFNTGYFALVMNHSDYSNLDIDSYRQLNSVNTYNNKVFGLLFLVAELNNVSNIDVTVNGIKNASEHLDLEIIDGLTLQDFLLESSDLTALIFEIQYEYNCPDGYYVERSELYDGSDELIYGCREDFLYLSENTDKVFEGSRVIITPESGSSITTDVGFTPENGKELANYTYTTKPVYNRDTNMYTATTYKVILIDLELGTISYSVIPKTSYVVNQDNILLDSKKVSGSINLNLIGSGDTLITKYKYYWNNSNITLQLGLSLYPLYGLTIEGVYLELYDITNNDDKVSSGQADKTQALLKRLSYNGDFSEYINMSDLTIGHMYLLKLYYKYYLNLTLYNKVIGYRILFNSPILNEWYYDINIQDYSTQDKIEIPVNANISSETTNLETSYKDFGNVLYGQETLNALFTKSTLNKFSITYNDSYTIDNSEYYPFEFNGNGFNCTVNDTLVKFDATLTKYSSGTTENISLDNYGVTPTTSDIDINNSDTPSYWISKLENNILVSVNAISKIQGNSIKRSITVLNKLEPFSDDINSLSGLISNVDYITNSISPCVASNQKALDTYGQIFSCSRNNYSSDFVRSQTINNKNVRDLAYSYKLWNEDTSWNNKLINFLSNYPIYFMTCLKMVNKKSVVANSSSSGWYEFFGYCPDELNVPKSDLGQLSQDLVAGWETILWKSASTNSYVLVNLILVPDSNGGLLKDLLYVLKLYFRDVYILQPYNLVDLINTIIHNASTYNSDYNLNTIVTSGISISKQDNVSIFTKSNLDYNIYLNTILSKYNISAVLNLFHTSVNSTINVSTNVTSRILGTSSDFVTWDTKLNNSLDNIYIDDTILITQDSNGNEFTNNKIYRYNNGVIEDCSNDSSFSYFTVGDFNDRRVILVKGEEFTFSRLFFMRTNSIVGDSYHVYGSMGLLNFPGINIPQLLYVTHENFTLNQI